MDGGRGRVIVMIRDGINIELHSELIDLNRDNMSKLNFRSYYSATECYFFGMNYRIQLYCQRMRWAYVSSKDVCVCVCQCLCTFHWDIYYILSCTASRLIDCRRTGTTNKVYKIPGFRLEDIL